MSDPTPDSNVVDVSALSSVSVVEPTSVPSNSVHRSRRQQWFGWLSNLLSNKTHSDPVSTLSASHVSRPVDSDVDTEDERDEHVKAKTQAKAKASTQSHSIDSIDSTTTIVASSLASTSSTSNKNVVSVSIPPRRNVVLYNPGKTLDSQSHVFTHTMHISSMNRSQSTPSTSSNTAHIVDHGHMKIQLEVSSQATANGRRRMEDFLTIYSELHLANAPVPYNDHRWGWFAVADGHGGSSCAEAAIDRLFIHFQAIFTNNVVVNDQDGQIINPVGRALELALRETDKEWIQEHRGWMCGSCYTMILADWTDLTLYVLNLGDCKTCVWHEASETSFETEDHDPLNPIENTRITNAGGWVDDTVSKTNGMHVGRVNGILAVARALGNDHPTLRNVVGKEADIHILPLKLLQNSKESQGTSTNASTNPNHTVPNQQMHIDVVAVLASDGLWDNYDVEHVKAHILRDRKATAATIVQEAINPSSQMKETIKDNVSSIVVRILATSL